MELLIAFALGVGAGCFVKKQMKIEGILNVTLVVLVFAMGTQAARVELESWTLIVVPIFLMMGAVSMSVLLASWIVKLARRGR